MDNSEPSLAVDEAKVRKRPRRLRIWVATMAATAGMLIAGTASPAHADPILLPGTIGWVQITEPQVDFGAGNLNIGGQPTDDGHIIWMQELNDPDMIWPHLGGRIFINNAAGLCARMQLRYVDHAGDELAVRNGGTVCAPSNRVHAWTVDLMPYGSDRIFFVDVILQTVGSNGWATTVGYNRKFVP